MATTVVAPRRSRSGWPFLAIIAGAVLLMLAGIVVAVIVSHNEAATTYDPSTPEGTVQRYLSLLQSGKTDQAYGMTRLTDYGGQLVDRARFHEMFDNWGQNSHQVTLNSTTLSHSHASVRAEISSFSGGPFGASTDSSPVTFTLFKTGGRWLITGPSYIPGS